MSPSKIGQSQAERVSAYDVPILVINIVKVEQDMKAQNASIAIRHDGSPSFGAPNVGNDPSIARAAPHQKIQGCLLLAGQSGERECSRRVLEKRRSMQRYVRSKSEAKPTLREHR
jgi:hypothetical protein